MQPSTTTHNHPQPPKKPPTTIHNHPKLSTTTHNHPQLPKKPTQSSTTIQELLKKAKTCHKQWCYSILDVHTETDVEFW